MSSEQPSHHPEQLSSPLPWTQEESDRLASLYSEYLLLLDKWNARTSTPMDEKHLKDLSKEIKSLIAKKEASDGSPESLDLLSREMRSLFAGSFFGPEEIESAFTMKDAQGKDVKLIELTPQERQ
ncbi:hypothetical protein HYV73_00075, partial [Candidatus Uhrbacteria bacterium]|nr:hypothetical protein [Candidatus Uhrbacteria bacterium]